MILKPIIKIKETFREEVRDELRKEAKRLFHEGGSLQDKEQDRMLFLAFFGPIY